MSFCEQTCQKETVDPHEIVQDYYGKVLQTTDDLKTNACCTLENIPTKICAILALIHPEVVEKYYGCGLNVPALLEGCNVLDLGCGAGRDCYLLSKLVGENGYIVGIDMTDEQIEIAARHVDYHMQKYGYKRNNVEFRKGFIEDLSAVGLSDNFFDIIVSNCVINLSPNKEAVLREAFRVLKVGGELYFSDVYASRRVPEELLRDPVLYGECLSGALYWNDFLRIARKVGFIDARLVKSSKIEIHNEQIAQKIGHIDFYSATYRLFKLPEVLETDCEDYGQAVIYKGTIPGNPHRFELDGHHLIETGKVFPVCGNTYHMLHDTRFGPHFEYIGNKTIHYGIFSGCGKSIPFSDSKNACSSGGCC